jgi:hypothetical protein
MKNHQKGESFSLPMQVTGSSQVIPSSQYLLLIARRIAGLGACCSL